MTRERTLKVVLVVVGLIFCAFLYPFLQPKQSELMQMFLGIYVTLGVFLLLAARNPSANRSLICLRRVVEPGARLHHGGAVSA